MASKVILPKQGLQMTEGTITRWLVAEGEMVAKGEPLFEMETDKLTITIDALEGGTLLKIIRGEGETVPITETIALVGEPGEDLPELLDAADTLEPKPAAATSPAPKVPAAAGDDAPRPPAAGNGGWLVSPRAKMRAAELGVDLSALTGSAPGGMVVERDILEAADRKPKATPLARKLAKERGVELSAVTGSGPRGKITRADIPSSAVPYSEAQDQLLPFTGMRKVIAQRMKESQEINAQATHRIRVDMTEAARIRGQYKSQGRKLSYNDLIALCTVRALTEHPRMNAELTEEGLLLKGAVHLGMAVALDEGLVVPVVKNAHCMSLGQLAASIRELAQGARGGTLSPDACRGGSFTISNLGMYGLEEFTAIINPPETGILAVGAVEEEPVVLSGQVEIRPILRLTLSYDHRVVDGAPAAEFLSGLRDYLETPSLLL